MFSLPIWSNACIIKLPLKSSSNGWNRSRWWQRRNYGDLVFLKEFNQSRREAEDEKISPADLIFSFSVFFTRDSQLIHHLPYLHKFWFPAYVSSSLSVCPSVSVSASLCLSLSVCLILLFSSCLFICFSLLLSACRSVSLSSCLCLSDLLSLSPFLHLSVCLSVSISFLGSGPEGDDVL